MSYPSQSEIADGYGGGILQWVRYKCQKLWNRIIALVKEPTVPKERSMSWLFSKDPTVASRKHFTFWLRLFTHKYPFGEWNRLNRVPRAAFGFQFGGPKRAKLLTSFLSRAFLPRHFEKRKLRTWTAFNFPPSIKHCQDEESRLGTREAPLPSPKKKALGTRLSLRYHLSSCLVLDLIKQSPTLCLSYSFRSVSWVMAMFLKVDNCKNKFNVKARLKVATK